MGKHFLGTKIDGKMGVFKTHCWNDEEFEKLVQEIGGFLPPHWVAWHLEDNETIQNSKKAQRLGELPSVIGQYGAEPSKRWIQVLLEDEMKKYKEAAGL